MFVVYFSLRVLFSFHGHKFPIPRGHHTCGVRRFTGFHITRVRRMKRGSGITFPFKRDIGNFNGRFVFSRCVGTKRLGARVVTFMFIHYRGLHRFTFTRVQGDGFTYYTFHGDTTITFHFTSRDFLYWYIMLVLCSFLIKEE